jgi:hypothetical protein
MQNTSDRGATDVPFGAGQLSAATGVLAHVLCSKSEHRSADVAQRGEVRSGDEWIIGWAMRESGS